MQTQTIFTRERVAGLAFMLLGVLAWWYNWHLATGEGKFSIKLCLLAPLGVAGGLLMALRPDWAGPWQPDASRGRKAAMVAVCVFMAAASGFEFFRLRSVVYSPEPRQQVIAWSPAMGKPVLPASLSARVRETASEAASQSSIAFLGRRYRLGSFNQRNNAMWEFVTGGETVSNWTTLLTLIDRPDARTRQDLDRLAEGILSTYRSRGAKILLARTMGATPQTVFNYAVVAFDEPKEHRYELNFVKMQLGSSNAMIAVYGVRLADAGDYAAKARAFLDSNSEEIGRAMEGLAVPGLDSLPRREF